MLDRACHAELLDAAHIVPDADEGEPVIPNGLALCKLHHAAFDRYFLGVRPDYVLQVRPDQHFLERRYENFRRA